MRRYIGVDLAWAQSQDGRAANESGMAVLDPAGRVLDAGWSRTLHGAHDWIRAAAGDHRVVLFVDAPLVVDNPNGQRVCETELGLRYRRWKLNANSTSLRCPRLAGLALRALLEASGWRYDDGRAGPPASGKVMSECHPYTTLVGASELGYDYERPNYRRKPPAMGMAAWRPLRAAGCDELIRRMTRLDRVDPPLLLYSHPLTHSLAMQPSPLDDAAYKHRQDLIDALLCAWTAAFWHRHGLTRSQVLGPTKPAEGTPVATIIAPARPEQRRFTTGAALVDRNLMDLAPAARAKTADPAWQQDQGRLDVGEDGWT